MPAGTYQIEVGLYDPQWAASGWETIEPRRKIV